MRAPPGPSPSGLQAAVSKSDSSLHVFPYGPAGEYLFGRLSIAVSASGATVSRVSEAEFESIRVAGIVKERVGRPRNDGTPGSALYAVPLQLSRTPSATWSEFFRECWNHPPSFTTMHRPGIARVAGDTVVLDGTTIDEVERYHLDTVRLCVARANDEEIARLERARRRAEQDEAERQVHEAHVDEVADRLKFD